METKKIYDLFNSRFFEIPKYQRGFAWELDNVRDLFDDIIETLEDPSPHSTNHYIGPLVLSRNPDKDDKFYIVDGQQRITTLTLIIDALLKYHHKDDARYFRRFYIQENGNLRLILLGKDSKYYENLLNGVIGDPENKSQRLLKNAYEWIQNNVEHIKDKKTFMQAVTKLQIMEFIEDNEGDAIRIFQTVNARGKVLTDMEKAKSLLIYFSNKYLKKALDNKINTIFGEIFELYDDIKHTGETLGISLIKDDNFNEDNIMRYHFVTFSKVKYDATTPYILKFFLKDRLSGFRKDANKKRRIKDKEKIYSAMERFINSYVESLHEFFKSLKDLTERAKNDEKYYKIFVVLGLSATLYPLIVKLEILGLLDKPLSGKDYREYTFLDLLELIDVRVYKTRNTNPRAEISRFARELKSKYEQREIQDWLIWYNKNWMSKEQFLMDLNGNIYRNTALPHIFIEYSEQSEGKKYSMDDLQTFVNKNPTIEHILAKTQKLTYKSIGFKGNTEFVEYQDKLGNLTILEKNINSAAQNKVPVNKVSHYDKSLYKMTRQLATFIDNNKKFNKKDIENRTKSLAKELSERWWC